MLKGIEIQFQGIKTYLQTNKNSEINNTWECYCLNIQKIVLEIFHLNLMIMDNLESTIPRSLRNIYQDILAILKIFLKNKPVTDERDDFQNDYFPKEFDEVDKFMMNRPQILNNNEGRGDLYKFLMQTETKQKNNDLFLKQIPIFNQKQSSNKLKTMKSSTIELLDGYKYNNHTYSQASLHNNQQTQTQVNQKSIQDLLHYILSLDKKENKFQNLFNDFLQVYAQKIKDPSAISNNLAKIINKSDLEQRFIKKQDNKQDNNKQKTSNSPSNQRKPSNKHSKTGQISGVSGDKKKQPTKRQSKISTNKKKDTKRHSTEGEDIKRIVFQEKAKETLLDTKQHQQANRKKSPDDKQNSIEKQFQQVLKKYCVKTGDSSGRQPKGNSSSHPERRVYPSSNQSSQQARSGDNYSKMSMLIQRQKSSSKRDKYSESMNHQNIIDEQYEYDQDSIGQLNIQSNINKKSRQYDNQNPTYDHSKYNEEYPQAVDRSSASTDKKNTFQNLLSNNQKSASFNKKPQQNSAMFNSTSPDNMKTPTFYYSDEIVDRQSSRQINNYQTIGMGKIKERQRIISNKNERRDKIQHAYLNATMNKGEFKSQYQGQKQKALPRIVEKNKKGSIQATQYMKKAYEHSPYTQCTVNYNKHVLSKNASLPTFNYKSLHYNQKSNTVHQKIVNISQTQPQTHNLNQTHNLKPLQTKKSRQLLITDQRHLIEHEDNLMKEINQLGETKNVKSGQWIKLMNKIKNYELIHKSFCGQQCIHLIKFNEFLRKNKNKLYLHRRELQMHKKDIFLYER